jgi:hypothetical protein
MVQKSKTWEVQQDAQEINAMYGTPFGRRRAFLHSLQRI